MYGNNSNNNAPFAVGYNNSTYGQGLGGLGNMLGGLGGNNGQSQTNPSPTLQPTSPEAKARLGIVDAPTGVDRSGMDANYQKRHFASLAAADAKYAGSANAMEKTALEEQALNNRMTLGTNALNYNAQTLQDKNKKEPTVYDSSDYNTWFDDMV